MAKPKYQGFTIVELLIVIVVVGILAAITIVSYNGIQARANVAKTLSVANQVEKAVRLWNTDTGLLPFSGGTSTGAMPANPSNTACPGATGTGGWVGSGIGYACSLEDLLVAYKMIPANLINSLPPNKVVSSNPKRTLMFYSCSGVTNGYILMWYLEYPSAEDNASFDQVWQKCTNNASATAASTIYYTSYGMRNGKIIAL